MNLVTPMEFEFRVTGTLTSGDSFRTEIIVVASDLNEAESELAACLNHWEVVRSWRPEGLLNQHPVEPNSWGATRYAEKGAFSIYDPDLGNEQRV